MAACLLIFLRHPILGQVKTRLAADVGPARALAVYRALLAHTRRAATALPADVAKWLCYADAGPTADEWPADLFTKKNQVPGDLGQRLKAAFADAFAAGHGPVVVIGTDCPALSPELLKAAFEHLRAATGADVVLGPAADGGYYLLGVRRPQPDLFDNIAWSTAAVAAQTRARCQAAGLRVAELPPLSDVDTGADLAAFPALANLAG